MKSVVFALVLALVLGVVFTAGNTGDIYTIDSFDINSATLVVVIQSSSTFPLTQENTVKSSTIFSGERDLLLSIETGPAGMVYSTSVDTGDWTSSAPSQGSGFALLQYDGVDSSSNLNPSGASSDPNNDFTANGAVALHLYMSSDQATTVEIFVYSGSSSDYCSHIFQVPGTQTFADYIINYSQFDKTGNGCDFTNVGAVEVTGNLLQNVDLTVQFFATYGTKPSSPSRTPTPTRRPAASASNTPTRRPAASASNTPTRAASKRPTQNPCNCVCPAFHCVLEYDPSGVNTYYFQTSVLNGASGNGGNGGNSSSASTISTCFALFVALVVLLI